ncbi:beta-ketoacyl-ACP synthase II [Vulgatibacter incomptus]|uniref:3-oxoacyl-[acyl-carrier-protein] synthase 2 n=1 Tax=Vulgatibacter incomptus TaxID=1391653 RepID=A0A0K1PCL6_9BACT|nr:beta-ketoacyl-ACP synthase II [Vulgatibacter incomptus]AKU91242.1 3-oxoacyl-[acyl-carrier-protein] synthase, KASII [Vulgatibacter incomptus]
MKRRVVVTGMGMVSAVGIGVEEGWKALLAGTSGIDRITLFDPTDFTSQIAGEVKGFEPEKFIDKKEARRMDRFVQLGMAACDMAMRQAGFDQPVDGPLADRFATILGSGIGGLSSLEDEHKTLLGKGPKRLSPFFIPMMIANLFPGHASIRWGAKGPSWSPVSACATGAHAIGEALKTIQRGDADMALCGGAEAAITPLGIGGFNAMRAMSTRNDSPHTASRPFDKDRDGFVQGEGAGVLVIEELEHAKARGAQIICELVGYATTADAHHITAPSPDGAPRCIQLCLNDAGLRPEEVGYINAHGTSTPLNDANETAAIKTVFGEHAYKLAVSSTKSMTGHTLGAAGGIEAVISALALLRGVLPPTTNYQTPDPDCDLDYVPNQPREVRVDAAISNSFGFGGTNVVLAMRRWRG